MSRSGKFALLSLSLSVILLAVAESEMFRPEPSERGETYAMNNLMNSQYNPYLALPGAGFGAVATIYVLTRKRN